MSSAAARALFITGIIPFDRDFGLLGANTNGAPPQAVFGIGVDAVIDKVTRRDGRQVIEETYWFTVATSPKNPTWSEQVILYTQERRSIENLLKVLTTAPNLRRAEDEYVFFTSDLRSIEQMLGSIAVASRSEAYGEHIDGDFRYQLNDVQLMHVSADTCPVGTFNSCHVMTTPQGFSMRFANKEKYFVSLEGKLSASSVLALLDKVAKLREFRNAKFKKLSQEIEKANARRSMAKLSAAGVLSLLKTKIRDVGNARPKAPSQAIDETTTHHAQEQESTPRM